MKSNVQFYRENWEVIFSHLHQWLGSDQAVADELVKLLPDKHKVRNYRGQIRKFRTGQSPNSDMSYTMGKAVLYLHKREREKPHLDGSRKQCIKCKQIKNVKEFPKRSGGVKGCNTVCKKCCSQFASE
jgi:hypothetical protein